MCSLDAAILNTNVLGLTRNLTGEHFFAVGEQGLTPCASTIIEIVTALNKAGTGCGDHIEGGAGFLPAMLITLANVAANTQGSTCLASLQGINFSSVDLELKPWVALETQVLPVTLPLTPPPSSPIRPGDATGDSGENNDWTDQPGVIAGIAVGAVLSVAVIGWLFIARRRRRHRLVGGGGKGQGDVPTVEVGKQHTPNSSTAATSVDMTGTYSDMDSDPSTTSTARSSTKSHKGGYADAPIVKIVSDIVREAGVALLNEKDVVAKRSIGQGSHGVVYSARWINSNMPVAVKVLQLYGVTSEEIEKAARAITTELAVLNSVRHPSVIYVYGVIVTSDAHTPGCAAVRIVMELAECSLQQLLTEASSPSTGSTMSSVSSYGLSGSYSGDSQASAHRIELNLITRLRIAESVASGLSHLHTARVPVVHRDLKPANILIRRQGDNISACIADFGVALLDKIDMTMGNPGSYRPEGTLMYMVGVLVKSQPFSVHESCVL